MTVTTNHGFGARGSFNTALAEPQVVAAQSATRGHAVYLDLDTVLLATHRGRRGPELGVQADLAAGIGRLTEIADQIVILVFPAPTDVRAPLSTDARLAYLREHLGQALDGVVLISCPHSDAACDCAKPGSGLIQLAIERYELPRRGGWYIGADQEGVVSGRTAGLRTVRIGPLGEDHLSAVHKADYEARDLLDAANHILIEELS